MNGPITTLLLVGGGFAAGLLNTLAGGGSLLTLPLLIFLGQPALLANGTNRVALLAQGLLATAGFRRGGEDGLREGLRLAAPMVLGSGCGALGALALGPLRFRNALGVVLLVMAVVVVLRRPPSPKRAPAPAAPALAGRRRTLPWLMLLLGLYAGFAQAGVGVLMLAALVSVGGHAPVRANAIKVVVIAASTLVSLAIYASRGQVDWRAGALLAIGMGAGGWCGARLQLGPDGVRWIRPALAIAVLAAAVKLLTSHP